MLGQDAMQIWIVKISSNKIHIPLTLQNSLSIPGVLMEEVMFTMATQEILLTRHQFIYIPEIRNCLHGIGLFL